MTFPKSPIRSTSAKHYVLAIALVAGAILLRIPLYPVLGSSRPYLLLFGVVAVVAWLARWRAAALAAVLGFIASHVLLTSLGEPFTFDSFFLAEFVFYGFSTGLIIFFGEAMHRARERAEREASERHHAVLAERQQTDLFRVTLASIGDGVIVTDAESRVQSLNAEAERLTGWQNDDAIGRPLAEVFRIVNEVTEQPVENPVEKVLRLGVVVGLANHTVLIAKDGTRVPIDDSAAPIREGDGPISGVVLVFRDVTEQRVAQRAQAHLAAVVRFSGDAIVTKDLNGIVQSWNAGAEQLFGYRPEEIVGKPITILVPPERAHEETEILNRLRDGKPTERLETVRVAKDGRRIHLAVTVSPLHDAEGEVVGASKILRDITDALAARDAMAREKELLGTTLASIGDGVIVTDAHGVVTFLNPEAARLTGWSLDDAVGLALTNVFRIVNEHTRESVENPVDKVLRLGTVVGLANHTVLVSKDGTETPIDDSAAPIRHGDGTLFGVVLVFRDFTARRLAEEKIRASEARFRTMADAAPVLIWVSGTDKLCTWFNQRWLEFVGRTMEQEAGNGWAENVHPDDFDACLRTYVQSFDAREPFSMTYRLKRHDGEYRWILDNGVPRFDAAGEFEGYIGSCVDVTDRIRAEEALQDADRRKDEFLAVLSHELRNPLAPIRIAVELLKKREPDDDDEARSLREIIERQTLQLARLLDDLLDVSRIASGKIVLHKNLVDLAEAVPQAVESVRPQIDERQQALEVGVPDEPMPVDGDMTRLAEIVANLLGNASKYTPAQGRIQLVLAREGSDAVLRVRDSGIGIEADHLPRIFDMFSQFKPQLEREQSGLGVGLALTRKLVELHNGRIDAYSEGAGRGSEFVVRLPLAMREEPHRRRPADVPRSVRPTSRHILIADDNIDSAEVLAIALRALGHDVAIAHDGLATLEAAEARVPDVAILDIGMPKMNGFDVARNLRARFSKILLIAVTGWGQEADRRLAAEAGFDHHLTKPVDITTINQLLNSAAFSPRSKPNQPAA